MKPFRFALVGAGWRANFFHRIVRELPERFELAGAVVRNPEKAALVRDRWGCRVFDSPDDLLRADRPEFWVSSVSYHANFEVNLALVETDVPVLSETPPAASLGEMHRLWQVVRDRGAQVQVAEQFHRQPHHAARLAAARAGRIGTPHTASVSVSHGYHGTSLIRHYLGIGFETATIYGQEWSDRVLDPGGRDGPPLNPSVEAYAQQIALLRFENGCQALFDFSPVQYFSHLRPQRVCIRGDRGEIADHTLYCHNEQDEPVALAFVRKVAGAYGNLEGLHLKGIQLGTEWVYRNPTAPARLSDEEIAMAAMLQGMGEYVRGGEPVYPLVEAMQDHYLGLCIRQACTTGAPVIAARQPWAPA